MQKCGSLYTVQGLDIPPLHLSCYTVPTMPGEWTLSPVAMIKDQINVKPNQSAETMQQVLLENAIVFDATDAQQTEA